MENNKNINKEEMNEHKNNLPTISIVVGEPVVDVCTPEPKKLTFSPPYKRIRALRLFSSPHTPNTIVQDACTTPLRTRLFPNHMKPVPVACPNKNTKPVANVNPFTPKGMLLSKKRTQSLRSPLSDSSDMEFEEQPSKRIALQESNISRYHEEFYELELIGKGQFGSVYKCINKLDGCVYAIKKSIKPVAGSCLEKISLNEVYAHAVLGKHKHVVGYYSAWAEDNHMIIQNEYCDGGSLADKISSEPLTQFELRRLLLHVAEGLRYIHCQGLVHLDIKPENIFISHEKKIISDLSPDDSLEDLDDIHYSDNEIVYKIGDLGHVTSLADPQVEEGDCRYLPFEILQEDYSHLTKADVFSFGLTLLEAAGSGPLPKNGDEWHQIRNGILPKLTTVLSNDFIQLIKSMIHSEPANRPSAVQLLQHRALSPVKKTNTQFQRELTAERLKNEILSKQLVEAAKYIKSLTPTDNNNKGRSTDNKNVSRLIGKKTCRSFSTTTF